MKNCNCHSEINRDGSGQLQRYLKELDPSYAPIDGRSLEDLLVFAKRYAAQIRFYDIPESNIVAGEDPKKISWREFFRRDMSVIAASIANTNVQDFKKEFDEVRDKLQHVTTPEVYAALFAPITGMLKKIDRWYTVAIPENPLYGDLELAINSNLKQQVQKIIAYDSGFKYVDPKVELKIDLKGLENENIWGINEPIDPDSSIYQGTTTEEKILYASLFVEDIFLGFYGFLSGLVENSSKYIHFALEQYPAHQPHMALFIAFLEIFRKAQDQLNGVTGGMLDFYYKDVLQLEKKPSVPDKVHIVFELAKDVAEYGLAKGTELNAGKDNTGVEQVYKTSGDLVINQAKIKELKTIFIEKDSSGKDEIIRTIYARPAANSLDGKGEKFTEPYPKWLTFGEGSPETKKPVNICEKLEFDKKQAFRNDRAKIGFAIASPQLLLQGGKRLITLKLDPISTNMLIKRHEELIVSDKVGLFEFWFTGEKKWFKVNEVMSDDDQKKFTKFFKIDIFNPADGDIKNSYYFDKDKSVLHIYLSASEEPVISYDSKIHSDYTYSTSFPVMQVLLNPQINLKASDYNTLDAGYLGLKVKVGSMIYQDDEIVTAFIKKNISLLTPEEIAAFINFQSDGLTKLIIQNELELVKPEKSFDPFTPYPAKGKSFYIGSPEAFNKPLEKLSLIIKKTTDIKLYDRSKGNIDKGGDKSNDGINFLNQSVDYDVSVLERRRWIELCDNKGNDFSQFRLLQNILRKRIPGNNENVKGTVKIDKNAENTIEITLPRSPILDFSEWTQGSEKGFIRISNLVTTGKDMQGRQNQAVELEIKEVSLSYESTLLNLENTIDEFYHIYPFGSIQVYLDDSPNNQKGYEFIGIRKEALNINPSSGNNFRAFDMEKDYLLVNAQNKLLPQFTFSGPGSTGNTAKSGNIKLDPVIRKGLSAEYKKAEVLTGMEFYYNRILNIDRNNFRAGGLKDMINTGFNQYTGIIQEEGMLYIGLENSKPLQAISLLFQFADGSAQDEDNTPPVIHWSYLTNNEWRPMKDESVISDGTFGFQTTGIVKVEIPADATKNNTVITGGLHWLCASVTENSNRIPMLVDVVPQAALAVFEDNNNDQAHFDNALASGSISKLKTAAAEVSKVSQPFSSFDGKHNEIGSEYYTRVSERLRHKGRAITPWDYEHLILERFPSVYKVKCISHTDPNCLCRTGTIKMKSTSEKKFHFEFNSDYFLDEDSQKNLEIIIKEMTAIKEIIAVMTVYCKDEEKINADQFGQTITKKLKENKIDKNRFSYILKDGKFGQADVILTVTGSGDSEKPACCGPQIAPGHVLIIPIANMKNRNALNPLQPKTPRRTLLEIESYIKNLTSPFVKVYAKNAVFEQILTYFRVKFYDGYDKGYYLKKLNEEIVHFLTPWAFDEKAEVMFGQKIYASSIINFIEEREYVDFISDFKMTVCCEKCCPETESIIRKTIESDPMEMETMQENLFRQIKGCCGMEEYLKTKYRKSEEITAKPCTPRSILVSYPQHLIYPYEEPVTPSPCGIRKKKKQIK